MHLDLGENPMLRVANAVSCLGPEPTLGVVQLDLWTNHDLTVSIMSED